MKERWKPVTETRTPAREERRRMKAGAGANPVIAKTR